MRECEKRHPKIIYENVTEHGGYIMYHECPLCKALDNLARVTDDYTTLLEETVRRDREERAS